MKAILKIFTLLLAVFAMLAITSCEDDHVHTPEKHAAVAEGCTTDGTREYWSCGGCAELFSDEACTAAVTLDELKLPATGHSPEADDGNCTTAVECTVCHTVLTEAKASHTPEEDDGDCTTAVECTVCHTVLTEAKASHTPEEDDGNCVTAVRCTVCYLVVVEAKDAHTPAEDDGDCTTAVECTVCDRYAKKAKDDHVPAADDGDCTTAVLCANCDQVVTEGKAEHTQGEDDGDCTTPVLCVYCDQITVNKKDNHTPAEDDGDCTTALGCTECECIAIEAREEHADGDLDGVCDYCEHKMDFVYDTENETYIVFTVEGLYAWREVTWKGVGLLLMRDIVLSPEPCFDLNGDGENESNWDPVPGNCSTIDGNGHSISGIIVKESSTMGFVGDNMKSGVIKNLHIVDIQIVGESINHGCMVAFNNGRIENCSVSGSISIEGNNVGGIAGSNFGEGTIIACYNAATIYASSGAVGGIVGQFGGGRVIGCYNVGAVSTGSMTGGIAGTLYGGEIIACYSTGAVTGTSNVGAISGYGDKADGEHVANYWTPVDENPAAGSGSSHATEKCIKVDGTDVTWSAATTAMNSALTAEGLDWQYAANTAADSATRPLVLSK